MDNDLPKLAAPAQRALSGAGITRLEQLTARREREIADLHGMGKNAMDTLRAALAERGLAFAADAPAHDFPRAIGNPATNALLHVGYNRLAQLNGLRAADILAIHGVGPKAIRILRETLAERGMAFADEE